MARCHILVTEGTETIHIIALWRVQVEFLLLVISLGEIYRPVLLEAFKTTDWRQSCY